MDEIRGLADEVRKAIKESQRTSLAVWQYTVIIVSMLGLAGGCAIYVDWRLVDSVSKTEYNLALERIRKVEREAAAVREVQAIQMADPKWLKWVEARNKAIRELQKNGTDIGSNSGGVR